MRRNSEIYNANNTSSFFDKLNSDPRSKLQPY